MFHKTVIQHLPDQISFADGTPINSSSLIVCEGQTGEIHCPFGSFLYILQSMYGHHDNATQQDPTEECSLQLGWDACDEETLDFLPFTTEESITNIQVPRRKFTCPDGRKQPINYAQIEYMCIQGMD